MRFNSNLTSNEQIFSVSDTMMDVNFSINSITVHACCVVIRLVDNRYQSDNNSRLLPQGGSSIRTVAINERKLYSCPFVDHFNGTYDVVCRLYDECHNISIMLDYLDYSAFRWDSVLIEKLLFLDSICRQPNAKHNYDPYIGWYRDNSTTSWRWVRGDVEVMTDDQLRSCITKLPSPVLLFGDSHLRYMVYYWLLLMDKLTTDLSGRKLYEEFTLDKFAMTFITFTLDESEIPSYGCVCDVV